MGRAAIAFLLGLFSPIVHMIGAEAFGSPGPTTAKEILGGALACTLYLGVSQFLVARKIPPEAPLRADERETAMFRQPEPGIVEVLFPEWPALASMLVPLVGAFFLIMALESPTVVYWQAFPMLVSGFIGTVAGAVAAHALGTSPRHEASD